MYDMPMMGEKELPEITLRENDLPEIRDWEVGGTYYLQVKVEQVGLRNRKDMDAPKSDRTKLEADFQVLSIKAIEDPELRKLEQADWQEELTKGYSGYDINATNG